MFALLSLLSYPFILCLPFSNPCHPIAVDDVSCLIERTSMSDLVETSLWVYWMLSRGPLYSSQVVMEAQIFHWWEVTQRMEQDALPYFLNDRYFPKEINIPFPISRWFSTHLHKYSCANYSEYWGFFYGIKPSLFIVEDRKRRKVGIIVEFKPLTSDKIPYHQKNKTWYFHIQSIN